jgi:hypothetical protein
MQQREKAISWLLHSLKIVLGDESIRRYIILHYNPKLTNKSKQCIRTFDAFVPVGKTREHKAQQIVRYCNKMIKKNDTVVFTATNIQRDKYDSETHFQSYIVDNNSKKVLVVDPAFDNSKDGKGIYFAEVSNEVVIPFFQSMGYTTQFVCLSNPAQVSDDDIFCQSWSLYILLQQLKNKKWIDPCLDIPFEQINKYAVLLNFYKQIFADMPELCENLETEYEAEILETRGPNAPTKTQKQQLLSFNPIELLFSMTADEM